MSSLRHGFAIAEAQRKSMGIAECAERCRCPDIHLQSARNFTSSDVPFAVSGTYPDELELPVNAWPFRWAEMRLRPAPAPFPPDAR